MSELPDWPPLAGAEFVRELSSGPLSRTLLIERDNTRLVLRIDSAAGRRFRPTLAEPAILDWAAQQGLAPALIAADRQRGLLLREYLAGDCLSRAALAGMPELPAQLGALLAGLHRAARPAALDLPALDLPEAASRYARHAAGKNCEDDLATVRRLSPRLLADAVTSVLAHNDVHPGNIIRADDGRLRLIDWEYAAPGPAGFELAIVITQCGLAADAQAAFLEAYIHAGGDPVHGMSDWIALARSISRLWQLAVDALR